MASTTAVALLLGLTLLTTTVTFAVHVFPTSKHSPFVRKFAMFKDQVSAGIQNRFELKANNHVLQQDVKEIPVASVTFDPQHPVGLVSSVFIGVTIDAGLVKHNWDALDFR